MLDGTVLRSRAGLALEALRQNDAEFFFFFPFADLGSGRPPGLGNGHLAGMGLTATWKTRPDPITGSPYPCKTARLQKARPG